MTMASMASLVNLGSAKHFEVSLFSVVQRDYFRRNVNCYRNIVLRKKWRYVGVCRFSVTTDYVTEQGTSVSLDSTYKGSKENESDLVLKAAPKPVLKPDPKGGFASKINSENVVPLDDKKLSLGTDNEEEKNKVIESLGEVLDKAKKLETSERRKVSSPVNRRPTNSIPDQRNEKSQNFKSGQNPSPTKSVWRKGNPVASVQKIVKDPPKTENITNQGLKLEGDDNVISKPVVSSRSPQPPTKFQPKLHAKPSAAPPPPPAIKKPTVLKDVGAAPKTLTDDSSKERKTILVDKFKTRKSGVDPLIAAAVLAPPKKPSKGQPGKFRDDFRKKGGPSSGIRRRLANDREIPDDEVSEFNVSIPGVRKGRKWSKASRKAARLQAAREAAPVKVEILEVDEEGMTTEELAYFLATSEGEILGYLFSMGIKPDGVQTIDRDMVKMICKEYEVEVIDAVARRVEDKAKKMEFLDEDDLDKLQDRPPVLTIMGHVDHGKTTLLDHIRKSKVAASEAGGITQGIGAYKLLVPIDGKSQPCVFLDTPGHEAFGAMRARGAKVTDIAIIVVAADDGIRPQTNEAIAHAKAAGVPIVIAINKIDKDGANPDRVMQELSSIGLMAEDWGGDTPMVKISALKGENVDELLETVMLVAELQELKANPNRTAKGTVIEAGLDKSKGPVATFIVQNGTLKKGDIVVCGEAHGKVRALFDDSGNRVDEAGPSIPVQVMGLNDVPLAGDQFEVVGSLDNAREKADARAESLRSERISAKAGDGKVTLSSYASAARSENQTGLDLHQLNIIMKVDVQGSVEAVRQALLVLPQKNVTLKFLLQATGDVSTSDVDLAVASKGIILGFNVKTPGSVKSYADNKGVEIRLYRVIYDLIDDMRKAMEGLLDTVEEQIPIGVAELRAVFSSGSGRIAGCMVTEGKVVKGCGVKVVRNGKTVHTGILNSLRRVKEMVKEVNVGLECGIGVEDFDDFEVGDVLEAFNIVEKKRTLEEASATMEAAVEGAGF